jgi:transcriptional regulator with XRE-family HTH domain
MNIGQAIKKVRTHLSMSQKDLAITCSLSQNSLSQIECGIKKPKEYTLEKICAVFQLPVSLMYLLAIEEEDVAECRRGQFPVLQMSITSIALQIAKLEKVPQRMVLAEA